MTAPVATLAGTLLLAFLSFSPFCEKNRSKYKILDIMAKYGNLFPYLIAMVAGVAAGELSKPVLELGTVIRIPDFSNIFHTVSIFAVGFPPPSEIYQCHTSGFDLLCTGVWRFCYIEDAGRGSARRAEAMNISTLTQADLI